MAPAGALKCCFLSGPWAALLTSRCLGLGLQQSWAVASHPVFAQVSLSTRRACVSASLVRLFPQVMDNMKTGSRLCTGETS